MNLECFKDRWDLDNTPFLNHGSYGATPLHILAKQADFEKALNRSRESFFRNDCYQMLSQSRKHLANFFNAPASNIALVENVTEGFNTALKSVPFDYGDELLITNHIYDCFMPVIESEAKTKGFKVITCEIPHTPKSDEEIIAAILEKTTKKTKLVIIEHITSATALIFPVKEIVLELKNRGIETLIDGAHAPGQTDVNLSDLAPTYYTGNHHKWLCAPISSGFLYVDPCKQNHVFPLISSHLSRPEVPFSERFDWMGTKNLSARILVPDTIDYMASLVEGGWSAIIQRNHQLAIHVRKSICKKLGVPIPYSDNFFGSMFTVPLGPMKIIDINNPKSSTLQIHEFMVKRFGFGACVTPFSDAHFLRVSCHLYNDASDYEKLGDAIAEITT